MPALVVDCRGKRCPTPVIELAGRVGDVAVGDVLGLLTDDPAAAVDVPAWCRMRAQEYLGEVPLADGVSQHLVRRTS